MRHTLVKLQSHTARAILVCAVAAMAIAPACNETPPERGKNPPKIEDSLLPYCWGVESTSEGSGSDIQRVSSEYGVRIVSIENVQVNAAGIPLRVNVVECATPEDAKKMQLSFVAAGQDEQKFALSGPQVYKFICDNRLVAAKMRDLLGLLDKPVRRWRVEMEVAPLDRSLNDMEWNAYYNAAVQNHRDPDDEDAVFELLKMAPDFDFGNTLVLRMEKPDWGAPQYRFDPQPKEQTVVKDQVRVTFDDLPVVVDAPRVKVEAIVPTRSFTDYLPAKVDKYNNARKTDPWPMTHAEVGNVIAQCYNPQWTQRENAESILCWVYHNIEYRGDVVGSRYGAIQVMRQRYGHCWDRADVFITMCRLVELPAREVFGWLVGQGGHVWAQVYLDDEGWVSVDPTCSWLGVTDEYIPLFITESGHPPFVYTKIPKVTPIE
jgi:hypothetical protein